MGRRAGSERIAAFRNLNDAELYTSADVSKMAPFEGTTEAIKTARLKFGNTLRSYYAPMLGDPDDHVTRGNSHSLFPAWLGSKWKKAGLGKDQ